MTDTQICPECQMEFDWPGVEANGECYCCEACSLGKPCECPQHEHRPMDTDVATPSAMGDRGSPSTQRLTG